MKKLILLMLATLLFLTSCLSDIKSMESKIEVLSPITVSSNSIEDRVIKIRMIEGKYYEDWNPGAIMGGIWEGEFNFEVSDMDGKVINKIDIMKIHEGESNKFTAPFDIMFDDYNNDGDIDFTIGQYASSNGNNYKIYTLRDDGKIEELKVKDKQGVFISNTTGFYSTKLSKEEKDSFSKIHYDNTKGQYIEETYKWNGKQFILTKANEVKL